MSTTDKAAELMERAKKHYHNTVALYQRAIAVAKAASGSVHEAEVAKEVDILVKEMYNAEAFKNEAWTEYIMARNKEDAAREWTELVAIGNEEEAAVRATPECVAALKKQPENSDWHKKNAMVRDLWNRGFRGTAEDLFED